MIRFVEVIFVGKHSEQQTKQIPFSLMFFATS